MASDRTVEARRRAEVEAEFGRPIGDAGWQWMVEDGILDDMAPGPPVSEVVRRYREIVDAFRPTQKTIRAGGELSAGPDGSLLGAQLEAVAVLLAQAAGADEGVARFRRTQLDGSLLGHEHVQGWIERLGGIEPPDALVELVQPPNTKITIEADGLAVAPPIVLGRGIRYLRVRPAPELEYTVPSDDWVHRAPVQIGGVLDELRELAGRMSTRYGWRPAHATTFVLTGLMPPVPGIRATNQVATQPGAGRLELSIDLAVTPAELASRYGALRKELRPGQPKATSPRHAALVAFVASRANREPWGARMEAWNALWESRRPRWRYTQVSNFQRDYARSRDRLLRGR